MSAQGEGGREEAGGGRQRWPRRRILLWAVGLVPSTLYGGWSAWSWLDERRQQAKWLEIAKASFPRVAAFCQGGHPQAEWRVLELLSRAPSYAPALLLRACLAMERGEWERARKELRAPALEGTPEARLLLELVERRPRAADWRHAFFESWQAMGKPDFRESGLLPARVPTFGLLDDPYQAFRRAGEEQQLLLAVLGMGIGLLKANLAWVLEQLAASESLALLLALHAQLSAADVPESLIQELRPVLVKRLAQLTGPSPRTLQLALLPLTQATAATVPFERQELEQLERLVELPVWKQPSSEEVFLETREQLKGVLTAPGHHAWMIAAWAQNTLPCEWLLKRGQVSQEHLTLDEQRWMGRLLWQVGTRLRQERSQVEVEAGLRLQIFGSMLDQHNPSREESMAFWVEVGNLELALEQAALYRWPLASLQEEACEARARNELAWMRAFAGKGELL